MNKKHIDEIDIARYLQGILEEKNSFEKHLKTCPDCFEKYSLSAKLNDSQQSELRNIPNTFYQNGLNFIKQKIEVDFSIGIFNQGIKIFKNTDKILIPEIHNYIKNKNFKFYNEIIPFLKNFKYFTVKNKKENITVTINDKTLNVEIKSKKNINKLLRFEDEDGKGDIINFEGEYDISVPLGKYTLKFGKDIYKPDETITFNFFEYELTLKDSLALIQNLINLGEYKRAFDYVSTLCNIDNNFISLKIKIENLIQLFKPGDIFPALDKLNFNLIPNLQPAKASIRGAEKLKEKKEKLIPNTRIKYLLTDLIGLLNENDYFIKKFLLKMLESDVKDYASMKKQLNNLVNCIETEQRDNIKKNGLYTIVLALLSSLKSEYKQALESLSKIDSKNLKPEIKSYNIKVSAVLNFLNKNFDKAEKLYKKCCKLFPNDLLLELEYKECRILNGLDENVKADDKLLYKETITDLQKTINTAFKNIKNEFVKVNEKIKEFKN